MEFGLTAEKIPSYEHELFVGDPEPAILYVSRRPQAISRGVFVGVGLGLPPRSPLFSVTASV